MNIAITVLICFMACSLIMTGVWIWAKRIKNAGVVDIFWTLNFPVIALILFFTGQGWAPRVQMVCSLIFIAGLRLGFHLGKRVLSHLQQEEGRYQQLRQDWAPHADRKFFWFFQFQGISNVILSLPFFLMVSNKNPGFHLLEIAGFVLWAIALAGEAIADWQLDQFKKDPANKGKVCSKGLWNYSRHPNYFFELLLWTAYFLIACTADFGWLALSSPLIIAYLLFKVTGIPATEAQAIRSKGAQYVEYQNTTSAFVPWFKKRKTSL
ncbi:DUF1295 domain-containing protein [Pedobacter nutrimenti]|jgi:steroid 5-alpha reductase family enzyme|uniref:Steroid 5-alpha reductase family enzyme n=1 Tax=Pedobacter nutrimenti TaxID=1241337 RepID=A0A318UDW0_9SPHI|nr:DUF1295 domain-containing protein [Pedobacter nutrimenti]PYF74263.1 steroid 5-alpha reductase family enzyme [Pedobacter nutrimenti]